jgi:thymidylate synthase (FAD)
MKRNLKKFTKPIPVLDKGHVRLVDVMGDDSAIVQSARVSYGKGTKTAREDEGLIRYLMRQWHTTPFQQCTIKLHVKAPIFVIRQWFRHRTFSYNEYSARYSELSNELYCPKGERLQSQSTTNKQGSSGELVDDAALTKMTIEGANQDSFDYYQKLLDQGLSRELARGVVNTNVYSEFYMQGDLHNLFHFLRLRMDSHAQWEIQQYAFAIAEIVKAWVPASYRAFEDYRLNAKSFSGPEMELLQALFDDYGVFSKQDEKYIDLVKENAQELYGLSKRETTEFFNKLKG